MTETTPMLKVYCEKCNKTIGAYIGNNYFMALILSSNKHPFLCKDCMEAKA